MNGRGESSPAALRCPTEWRNALAISDLWTFASHGGYSMAVILLLSVVAAVVAIERGIALWGLGEETRQLSAIVIKALYRGDLAEARGACERSTTPFADLLLAAFTRWGKASPERIAAAVERERTQVGLRLRARLWILGTIGAIAPFVGLFGTVIGIMGAFEDLAAHPGGGFAVVASGISEALIATAAGIAVALEAVVLYNFFSARLAALMTTLELGADEVLELLWLQPPAEEREASSA